jgi:type IX secretion system PorP/SprF family membrane protein
MKKSNTYNLLCLILVVAFIKPICAQDLHFSQFYANPLSLNPAMTAYMGGDHRAHINYKNQWQSISNPYRTLGLSYDRHFLRDELDGNWVGGGIQIINDVAGTSKWSNLKLSLSASYILSLAENTYLSTGMQIGFIQRSFSMNDLYFDSQILPSGVNTSLPSNENISDYSNSALDIGLGTLIGSKPNERLDIYAGLSFSHINRPKLGFNDLTYKLRLKTTSHLGLTYKVQSNLYFQPSLILQKTSSADEFIFGSSVAYDLTAAEDKSTFLCSAGFWYRQNDALIPYVGIEIESWKVGLSYDINTSDLISASDYKGGVELSLKWEIPTFKVRMAKAVPCPRF